MKVLIGCEFSGTVRDAFSRLGHDATSCDLLPSLTPGKHYQGDILDILGEKWDLFIGHPPCTFLTISQNRWLADQPERASGVLVGAARRKARQEAIEFFLKLYNADIPKIALENPVGCLSSVFRLPDQVIQPWQFGHGEVKKTCLWLKGLPLLKPTRIVSGRAALIHEMGPVKDRSYLRSITYRGIAEAMASQWSI